MIIYHANTAATSQLAFPLDLTEPDYDPPDITKIEAHNPLGYVRDYIRRDWHVFPLTPRSKQPIEGWQWGKKRVDEDDCEYLFSNTQNNIGIGLGELSGG